MNADIKINLDDPGVYRQYDNDGMLGHLHDFPSECEKASQMASEFNLPLELSEVDKVVVVGMGGSAIGGDLVSSIATEESKIPVLVHRGYHLPAYTDKRTLVISSSYSGNTEETLSCYEEGLRLGAKNLVITTGGKLKDMAAGNKVPAFSFDYKSPPRAALPYSFIPLLIFMRRLGFLKDPNDDMSTMFGVLRKQAGTLNEEVPETANPAKSLARKLHGRLAVIYGAETVAEVAHRWKTQMNENSKAWSFYEVFPELNHNAVVGFEYPAELITKILVVMVWSEFLSPRVKLRYEITGRMMDKAGIEYQTVKGTGENRLADMMSLILVGDYVSYYLAILNRTAPGPVTTIDYLKSELARVR